MTQGSLAFGLVGYEIKRSNSRHKIHRHGVEERTNTGESLWCIKEYGESFYRSDYLILIYDEITREKLYNIYNIIFKGI